ncbi:MAG: hypothetical protein EA422_03880 [Gemmatimonadales bacterium]|nr:MAG: hypothetical protein EA422_03880 [Gemmatimonadales bacterium]
MRTTLTLDPDVAREIEHLRRSGDRTLKEVVNETLRLGLAALQHPSGTEDREPYSTPSSSLGGALIPSLDDVAHVLTLAEGEDHP